MSRPAKVGDRIKAKGAIHLQILGRECDSSDVAAYFVPKADPSSCDDSDSAAYDSTLEILDRVGFLRRRACLTPEQTQYYRTLGNRTLWNVKAVERVAFDSRTELDLNQEGSTLREGEAFYALRNFSIHVPNTTFPPQSDGARLWGEYGDDPQGEASFTETMFEYYFALTYIDGSFVEIPAGRAAFISYLDNDSSGGMAPVSLTASAEGSTTTVTAESRFIAREFMEQRGEFVGTPICDANRSGNFTVETTIPTSGLHTGQTIPIRVKPSHQGNSTAYVSKVLLTLRTCKTDTWALSHATTPNQRREVDGCNGNPTTESSWIGTGAAEQMAWIEEGDLLRQTTDMKCLCTGDSFTGTYEEEKRRIAAQYYGVEISHRNASYTEYEPLEIDLVIPTHMIPPFNTSFFSFGHVLDLRLETLFDCDAPESSKADPLADLTHLKIDDEWRRWPERTPTEPRARRTLYATTPIQLEVTSIGQHAPVHYNDPTADAIYLTSATSPSNHQPKVNVTVQTQTQDEELVTDRYNIWQRIELDGFSRGTAFDLVSDIWQRKRCAEWQQRLGEYAAGKDSDLTQTPDQVIFG